MEEFPTLKRALAVALEKGAPEPAETREQYRARMAEMLHSIDEFINNSPHIVQSQSLRDTTAQCREFQG